MEAHRDTRWQLAVGAPVAEADSDGQPQSLQGPWLGIGSVISSPRRRWSEAVSKSATPSCRTRTQVASRHHGAENLPGRPRGRSGASRPPGGWTLQCDGWSPHDVCRCKQSRVRWMPRSPGPKSEARKSSTDPRTGGASRSRVGAGRGQAGAARSGGATFVQRARYVVVEVTGSSTGAGLPTASGPRCKGLRPG